MNLTRVSYSGGLSMRSTNALRANELPIRKQLQSYKDMYGVLFLPAMFTFSSLWSEQEWQHQNIFNIH